MACTGDGDNFDVCPNGKLSTRSLAMIVAQSGKEQVPERTGTIKCLEKGTHALPDDSNDDYISNVHIPYVHLCPLFPKRT